MSITILNPSNYWILNRLEQLISLHNKDQLWILDNLLFLHISGSKLYGMDTKNSDYDIRGVVVPPKDYWVGARLFDQFEVKDPDNKLDFVIYGVKKWIDLATKVNPNIIETAFVELRNPACIASAEHWTHVRSEVVKLVNQQAYQAFYGYSLTQLKKTMTKFSNKTGRQYIVEEFGFDLKFASHGFRLVNEGIELLRTGTITLPRPDAEFLKDVRYGKIYGPEDMDKCILDFGNKQEELKLALDESILPKKADFNLYNQLLMNTYDTLVHDKE